MPCRPTIRRWLHSASSSPNSGNDRSGDAVRKTARRGSRSRSWPKIGSRNRIPFIHGQEYASPSPTQGGSRMRESRTYGSVRGALRNERPYRDRGACHRPRRRLRIYLRPHPRVTASPLSLEELAKQASRRRVWDSRHCERSEAIYSFFTRRDGLLRFARNDGAGDGLLRGARHRARIRRNPLARNDGFMRSPRHTLRLSSPAEEVANISPTSSPRNGFAVIA